MRVQCAFSSGTDSGKPLQKPIDIHSFIPRHRVAQAYLNQKRLDSEAKQLHMSANNFAKQTQQWMQLIDGFSGALKVHFCIWHANVPIVLYC